MLTPTILSTGKENEGQMKIGTKVASVKNASKIGTVLETGLPNKEGVPWLKVRFGTGKGRWILADAVREYQGSNSILVPDGLVVLVRKGHPPELFQQSTSTATLKECENFLEDILELFREKYGQNR